MCAVAVEERERLRRTYENLEKKYTQTRRQKSSRSSSLGTRVDSRKAQKAERTSWGEDDSSSLTDDTQAPAGSPDDVHEGCHWKTSAAQCGGDGTMEAERVGRDTAQQRQQMSPVLQRSAHQKSGGLCLSPGSNQEEPAEGP